ncbi:FcoT family thioesterase [Streptomyces sp. NPDC051921]|uniref:FcoT family thioesterase n=1 Tax=Streptomyces sp. NPDC051921 TaxID=3155806 RepID=UPI00342762B9
MDGLAVAPTRAREYPTDEELLDRVMGPYKSKNCVYLKEAVVGVDGENPDDLRLTASCRFEIPESCYIDDTGHFNSVEFNICYNQMAYFLIAKSVKEGLVHPFSDWSLEDFWNRQLGDILITDFSSHFRVQMRGRFFRGEMEIVEIVAWEGSDIRDPLVVVRTKCRYWDEHGGDAHGEISVAITNPPALDGM